MNADGSGQAQLTRTSRGPSADLVSGRQADRLQPMDHAIPERLPVSPSTPTAASQDRDPQGGSRRLLAEWATDGRIYFCRFDPEGRPVYVYQREAGRERADAGDDARRPTAYFRYGLSPDAKMVAFHDEDRSP